MHLKKKDCSKVVVGGKIGNVYRWHVSAKCAPVCRGWYLRGDVPPQKLKEFLYLIRAIWWIRLGKTHVIMMFTFLLKQCLFPSLFSFSLSLPFPLLVSFFFPFLSFFPSFLSFPSLFPFFSSFPLLSPSFPSHLFLPFPIFNIWFLVLICSPHWLSPCFS